MQLKKSIIETIEGDKVLQGFIAKETGVEVITVTRWLEGNSDRLLNLKVLEVIKNHTQANSIEDLVEAA